MHQNDPKYIKKLFFNKNKKIIEFFRNTGWPCFQILP